MSKSKKWEKLGLLKLASIFEISATTVERAFSPVESAKSRCCNRPCNPPLNECLVFYIEKDVFDSISNDSFVYRFENMKNRKGPLQWQTSAIFHKWFKLFFTLHIVMNVRRWISMIRKCRSTTAMLKLTLVVGREYWLVRRSNEQEVV